MRNKLKSDSNSELKTGQWYRYKQGELKEIPSPKRLSRRPLLYIQKPCYRTLRFFDSDGPLVRVPLPYIIFAYRKNGRNPEGKDIYLPFSCKNGGICVWASLTVPRFDTPLHWLSLGNLYEAGSACVQHYRNPDALPEDLIGYFWNSAFSGQILEYRNMSEFKEFCSTNSPETICDPSVWNFMNVFSRHRREWDLLSLLVTVEGRKGGK